VQRAVVGEVYDFDVRHECRPVLPRPRPGGPDFDADATGADSRYQRQSRGRGDRMTPSPSLRMNTSAVENWYSFAVGRPGCGWS
jgi:hypothetical protein